MNREMQDIQWVGTGVGLFPANTLIRSSGLHSLAFGFGTFAYLCKRPSFLASRRFATGKPDADALMMYPGYAVFYIISKFKYQMFKTNVYCLRFDIYN